MFKQSKESLGLDFGSKELKWVQLAGVSGNRRAVARVEMTPLPEEEKDLLPALKEFVGKHRLERMPVAVSFQDESLHIRPLELPKMPQEDLMEAIRWQLRDIAEETIDDYAVHYAVLEEKVMPEIVRLHLLGFAMKKEAVQKKTALLAKAGLKPFFLEPAPVAMAHTIERIYPSEERGWVACCDLGYARPYFLVLGSGKLHFVRSLAGLPGKDFLSPEFPSKLSLELQHALDAFFIAHHPEKIEKIFLAGGGAENGGMASQVSKNIGIETEILNPFQGLERGEAFPLSREKPHLFGPAIGSAFLKP